MGKHATYRKRGGPRPVTAPIGPPPQPALQNQDLDLAQFAQGADDTGGTNNLYYSVLSPGPYTLLMQVDWQSVTVWSEQIEGTPGYYRASETGNGTTYIGESTQSPAVAYP